jgi:hypothetical protein
MVAAAGVYELAGNREKALNWAKQALHRGYRAGMLRREPALADLVRSTEISSMLGSAQPSSAAGQSGGRE